MFALSNDALISKACLRELQYAKALDRIILPVETAAFLETLLPTTIYKVQYVRYNTQDRQGVLALARALRFLPSAKPLPDPLPNPPFVPISHVSEPTEFAAEVLNRKRPSSLKNFSFPRSGSYFPSPSEWNNEVLYRLLVDRFSDGQEASRLLVDMKNLSDARPEPWSLAHWAESGAHRWQGGTLTGVKSKLDYLRNLGVTSIWLNPVFKQRAHLDTYHGYSVQDFLDVDPRIGDRRDLVDLVTAAHDKGIRVILDVIVFHSGANWIYPKSALSPSYKPYPERYEFGSWLGGDGQPIATIQGPEDGVWPMELQDPDNYVRAGVGDLGAGDIDDPNAEFRRTDSGTLRAFNFRQVITTLLDCYRYWIALTDCDGFCVPSLSHATFEEGRNFCGSIKEFAASLGKHNFLMVGEVARSDLAQDRYLDTQGINLNAALDTGEMRLSLNGVAKGRVAPVIYFSGFDAGDSEIGSHREIAKMHVSILDDINHVNSDNIRFSSEADSPLQVVVGTALQLFTMSIPCIYYGTEQALAGPEPAARMTFPEWKRSSFFLHEAMFGPEHPRKQGCDSLFQSDDGYDSGLPGFGPFMTAGHHCFDEKSPTYLRIAALIATRQSYKTLQSGRMYIRMTSYLGMPFEVPGAGELVVWSRILGGEEILCMFNSNPVESRSADVLVDAILNPKGSQMTVILNTAQVGTSEATTYTGTFSKDTHIPIKHHSSGFAYVEIRDIPPSEVIVLLNK